MPASSPARARVTAVDRDISRLPIDAAIEVRITARRV